jgi:signal transduction histidine kinase
MLLLGVFIVYSLSISITRQLRKVADTMILISKGDFTERIKITNHDEIGDLINSFNLMVDKLQHVYTELNDEISIRKKSEIELQTAKDKINKALETEIVLNDLKTRFISMVSHEYRTPLTIIQTTTYLLEKFFIFNNQEDFSKHLDRIRDTIKDMTNLLDSVLKIGRLESDNWILDENIFDLYDVILEIITFEEYHKSKNIHFVLNKNCNKCPIESDYHLILHVFNNLISNAQKYSRDSGEVFINLNFIDNYIQVKIKDNGIGIPKEDIPHLFEPFFRAKNSETIQGTGLGLNMVKRCLDLLNGTIEINSIEDEGTEFIVTLPVTIRHD